MVPSPATATQRAAAAQGNLAQPRPRRGPARSPRCGRRYTRGPPGRWRCGAARGRGRRNGRLARSGSAWGRSCSTAPRRRRTGWRPCCAARRPPARRRPAASHPAPRALRRRNRRRVMLLASVPHINLPRGALGGKRLRQAAPGEEAATAANAAVDATRPAAVRGRAARPAPAASNASSPPRATARKNSRRLSTLSGKRAHSNSSNHSTESFGDEEKRATAELSITNHFLLSRQPFLQRVPRDGRRSWRGGVSVPIRKRDWKCFRKMAALCRAAATRARFMERGSAAHGLAKRMECVQLALILPRKINS